MKHTADLEARAAAQGVDIEGALAGGNRTLLEPIAESGTPSPGVRYIVPARSGRAIRLKQGQRLCVINPKGTQVADAWAFKADEPGEFLSLEHSRAVWSHVTPKVGDSFATNKRRPILTMTEDTSPGVHDTVVAACDIYRYRGLGVEAYHDNCTDNLKMAMLAIGEEAPEVPSPFNIWMNTPVLPDGSIDWLPTVSEPGDHVTLKAEMDCIFAISACPQDIIKINHGGPSALELEVQPA